MQQASGFLLYYCKPLFQQFLLLFRIQNLVFNIEEK